MQQTKDKTPQNLFKYRVQGAPVEFLWSPTQSQRTRMDRALSFCDWLEAGKSRDSFRLLSAFFADFDVEALDLLVEGGERDAELLGGVGLVPVAAL